VLPLCAREGIGQVVYSPLAQGVLTGKYKPGAPPPPDSRAADPNSNMFMGESLKEESLNKVEALKGVAEQAGLTLPQLALAWVLRRPEVSSAIVGASRPEQVDQNASASGITLSPDILDAIDKVLGAA